eukprot:Filipodium_phascolosomae@DN3480_c0_g1_i1.p1
MQSIPLASPNRFGVPGTPMVASPGSPQLFASPAPFSATDSPLFDPNIRHELLLGPPPCDLASLPNRKWLIDPAGPIYLLSRAACAVLGVPGDYEAEREHLKLIGLWNSSVYVSENYEVRGGGQQPIRRFVP